MSFPSLGSLEVWGGVECTVARVGNHWRNQLQETGLADRPEDLAAIRSLGVKTFRIPVLMEVVATNYPDEFDWDWSDKCLTMMRELALQPIAGLLHHGSGPYYTSLLDPNFPTLLAAFAGEVARRYPWIDRFTPVNEPLTTARFSCLYGHWYPHAKDIRSFLRAVINQCKAIVLAMRAIREVNSTAQLVQTEDIGRTFSTPALAAQAEYENERRWLSLDLLCGRVDRTHPWHAILLQHGIVDEEIAFFLESERGPDIIGVNHYLTSDRYLDEDIVRYPAMLHGRSGSRVFADVEAVRIEHLPQAELGPAARLTDVWSRYRRPIAVTEVHHGCTREEQLRWLNEVWNAAKRVKVEGVDIRAVTVWSLFGAVDWNSLLTKREGYYEPGAFDVRAPIPRPTALARATRSLVQTGSFNHPVLQTEGWWRRDQRYYNATRPFENDKGLSLHPLLILGETPMAEAFARVCAVRGIHFVTEIGAASLDPRDAREPGALMAKAPKAPWAVVDAGFEPFAVFDFDRVQDAALISQRVAQACAQLGIPFVTFSSDEVFDGKLARPYLESDEANPVSLAGRIHLEHEQDCARVHPGALIVRTGRVFNAWDPDNFAMSLLSAIANSQVVVDDEKEMSPAYAPDLAHTVLDLLIDGETGLWHLPNKGQTSLVELARALAANTKMRPPTFTSCTSAKRGVVLASGRGWPMPNLDDAMLRFGRDAMTPRAPDGLVAAE